MGRSTALLNMSQLAEVRERDRQRLELQLLGDLHAGKDLLFQNAAEAAKEQGVLAPTPVPTAANEPT